MIINCPECQLQLSDKAIACPHCGYPMQPNKIRTYTPRKRKRLPNGFGQISEIKNKRLRKPFRAMITIGKTETGRPISKLLEPEAYFETYNDAYIALLNYNKNPYSFDQNITIKELYDRWSKEYYYVKLKNPTTFMSAWKYCEPLYLKKISEVRSNHIKECILNSDAPHSMKIVMKNILNMMYDYAIECDIIDKNYARNIKQSNIFTKDEEFTSKCHIVFTDEEMNKLWRNAGTNFYIDMILIQCYSGWRPQELCKLKISNIDLISQTMTGGMKTDAGKNRTIPIHPRIRGLVEHWYYYAIQCKSPTLFSFVRGDRLSEVSYKTYFVHFKRILEKLGLDEKHSPHDGRKHFVTQAKKYGVDEYAIKYIVGHTIQDLTESVYTERSIDWLKTEMEKIEKGMG